MSVSSSSSSSQEVIRFRRLDRHELDAFPLSTKCAVTKDSNWNLKINGYLDRCFVNHPCTAKFKGSNIYVHWSVLQLAIMYDLRLNDCKVEQVFDAPTVEGKSQHSLTEGSEGYVAAATAYIVNAIAGANWGRTIQLKERIQKKYGHAGAKKCQKFFEEYRGRNSIEVFDLIKQLPVRKRSRPVTSSSLSSNLRKKVKITDTSNSSSSSSNVVHNKHISIGFELNVSFDNDARKLKVKITQGSSSQSMSIPVNEFLSRIPMNIIKYRRTQERNDLVFTPLDETTKYITTCNECAVTKTKQWNLDKGPASSRSLPATYPYLTEFNGFYVLTYWAILQLMMKFDLTFEGRKVQLLLPGSPLICESADQLMNSLKQANLESDFNIPKGAQHFSNYDDFFEQRRGRDALELFNSIKVQKLNEHSSSSESSRSSSSSNSDQPQLENSESTVDTQSSSESSSSSSSLLRRPRSMLDNPSAALHHLKNLPLIISGYQNFTQPNFVVRLMGKNIWFSHRLEYRDVLKMISKRIIEDHLLTRGRAMFEATSQKSLFDTHS